METKTETLVKVKLLAPVKRGSMLQKGECVEIPKKEAERLLSLGFIEYCDGNKTVVGNGGGAGNGNTSPPPPVTNQNPTTTTTHDITKEPRDIEQMTKIEIMQELSLRQVPHNSQQDKEKLTKLLLNARKIAFEEEAARIAKEKENPT